MDEIPFQLRPALQSPHPTDEQVIKSIHAKIQSRLSGLRGQSAAEMAGT
jgi:hypothetical protein